MTGTVEEVTKAKGNPEFLQDLFHEIRTAVQIITGFVQLLKNENLSEENRKDCIKQLELASQNLNKIISTDNEIIKVSKTFQNKEREVCDLNKLLENLLNQFSVINVNPEVKLSVIKATQDEQSSIVLERQKLIQILSNLIMNAIKFTAKGSITFGYTIENENIKFFVSDTGKGIKNKDLKLIFKRYSQIKTEDEHYIGSGIGLDIVYKLVLSMRGEIWCESEIGKGSSFFFLIPYVA